MTNITKYQNIIFDLDSTLSSIEGIDELGKFRNIGPRIQRLTEEAMSGRLPFGEVFIHRLELIKPTRAELLTVGKLYQKNVTPGAKKLISWLQSQKIRVFVVTAGYTDCSYSLTDFLKINRQNVFANRLIFNSHGEFIGIDKSIPLWRGGGKKEIVAQILSKHPGKTICVGDGMNDWEASQLTSGFIYFGGVIFRPAVAAKTKLILTSRNLYTLKKFLI